MKIILIEKQIDLILEALQKYSSNVSDHQLLYATYESILAQKVEKSNYNKNITKNTKNVINL